MSSIELSADKAPISDESSSLAEHALMAEVARAAPSSGRLQITLTAFLVLLLVGMSGMTFVLVKRIFDGLTPAIRDDLAWKTKRGAVELAKATDLALALGDSALALKEFGDYRGNEDVLAIVALSNTAQVVATHGTPGMPLSRLFAGNPGVVREQDDRMVAWAPSIIEGSEVGRVALVISTARMRAGEALRRDILVLAAVAGVAALLVGVFFVSFYMGPLIALLERALNGLRELTQSLEERVKSRTLQLSRSKAKLEESLKKLHNTQRQLVEASRLTGMAEVATSVLHNVGNVLNSVNVSSHMVVDTLKRSKVDGLTKAVQLIRSGAADPAAFWTGDKGRRLPDYLEALAAELSGERTRMLGELEGLARNIDHIKVIISMQQAHAKSAGGVTEILKLSALIDDAISMNVVSYDKHHIDIVKDIDEIPEIGIDRHKVMQILMNLLSNARHAVKHGDGEKHISVALKKKGEDRVTITVSDNGQGIPPENMTKIFVHGFTTKREGHGFGLHSSALAARELGGSLTCASDGPGKGASFTLELPLKKPEADSDEVAA